MFSDSIKITFLGVVPSFILGAIGYFLIKRSLLGEEGLNALSRLVIGVTLPFLIFCRLIKDFSFTDYVNWWVFPLISVLITFFGLAVGRTFTGFLQGREKKLQFLSLVTFQNSGYLPLVLVASLLPPVQAGQMLIYLFLYLLGFNLLFFSFGVYLLTFSKDKKFEWSSLLNPPVIATLAGLLVVLLGINRFIPSAVLKPFEMAGDTTLPLAIFVVGGNIAAIRLSKPDKKAVALMILAKLIILPAVGLWLVFALALPRLLGLLIVIELAMPPATNLSVLLSSYKKEDYLISQGIFFGHIASLVTIPLFLSLYFMISMIK
jgi:hypothetical protein